MGLDSVSGHKYAKWELGQYPAILVSLLVTIINPYFTAVFFLLDYSKCEESEGWVCQHDSQQQMDPLSGKLQRRNPSAILQ